jgi:hypothetical protein
MKPESTEDLRRRLLQEEQVQMMISMRAYEIYKMRGSEAGHDAEDWFRAENEILTFLIQEESRREAYSHDQVPGGEIDEPRSESDLSKATSPSEEGGARPQAFEPQTPSETADRLAQPTGQLAEERAKSQSGLGVWSLAEPASEEAAPPIGKPTEATSEKKSRSRATSKSAEPRKSKSAASASKEGAEKKTAARRTASKKSPEGESKSKTARRKPAPPKTEE